MNANAKVEGNQIIPEQGETATTKASFIPKSVKNALLFTSAMAISSLAMWDWNYPKGTDPLQVDSVAYSTAIPENAVVVADSEQILSDSFSKEDKELINELVVVWKLTEEKAKSYLISVSNLKFNGLNYDYLLSKNPPVLKILYRYALEKGLTVANSYIVSKYTLKLKTETLGNLEEATDNLTKVSNK